MIKLKKETIKDIIEWGIGHKVLDLKTKYSEEVGNTVIYIDAKIQISETIGKTTITATETIELIYIVDTHALLTAGWELIA